tara:strand:- start:1022 stop:1432 length:411 start_codon:yes stop_codon:yes gene_type:complete
MNIFTKNEIEGIDKKLKRGKKIKSIKWEVNILNPIDDSSNIFEKKYCSIRDIADDHTFLPYDTWRNIAVGRSKVYDAFIKLFKVEEELFYSNILKNEDKGEQPPTSQEGEQTTQIHSPKQNTNTTTPYQTKVPACA